MSANSSGLDRPAPKTPAGWYPDEDPGRLRWWDGDAWTERTRTGDEPPAPTGPLAVRGTTGVAELDGWILRYRQKPDRPALQEIDLREVDGLVVSRNGDAFDVTLAGARPRSRPSFFSETSLRRSSKTSAADWRVFLDALGSAIRAARHPA